MHIGLIQGGCYLWHPQTRPAGPAYPSEIQMWTYTESNQEDPQEADEARHARKLRGLRISFWMHNARCEDKLSLGGYVLTRQFLIKEVVAFFLHFANHANNQKERFSCSHFPATVCPPLSLHNSTHTCIVTFPYSTPSCDSRDTFRWLGFCLSVLEIS